MKRKKLSTMLVLTMVMTESLVGSVHAESSVQSLMQIGESQMITSEKEMTAAGRETETPESRPSETKTTETEPPQSGVPETEAPESEKTDASETESSSESERETESSSESERETESSSESERETGSSSESERETESSSESERETGSSSESERETESSSESERETGSSSESERETGSSSESERETGSSSESERETGNSDEAQIETSKSKNEKESVKAEQTEESTSAIDLSLFINVNAYPAADTSETVQEIYQYLREKSGLNHAAACGVLANIHLESNFDPLAIGDGGTSLGLCQWHLERCSSLQGYCTANELDYCTVQGQLEYLQYELERSYPHVLNYLLEVEDTAQGAYDAAQFWCLKFEMPGNASMCAIQRGNLAQTEYYPESFDWTEKTPDSTKTLAIFSPDWTVGAADQEFAVVMQPLQWKTQTTPPKSNI